jgi:hypothetical protein
MKPLMLWSPMQAKKPAGAIAPRITVSIIIPQMALD